jgi:hypothetical protein
VCLFWILSNKLDLNQETHFIIVWQTGSSSNSNITSGLYYKPMTIVNDDSVVVNKLEASLTDDARDIIYDRHMFIVQATDIF